MSSFYNAKNVGHVAVCGNASLTAASTSVTSASSLYSGELAFIDLDNKTITDAGGGMTLNQYFRLVQSDGTTLHYFPIIKVSDIISVTEKAYTAPVQQVSYIGYVGSGTGDIQALDNNEYIVRLLLKTDTTSMFGNKQMYKFGAYKSGTGATAAEVAIGLTDSLYYNFKREAEKAIQFDAICNTPLDTAYDMTQTVTVVNGESFITTGDLAYNTAAGTLAVGDYIRIAATVTAPALTSAVYKVIKIDGTTKVWLDRPVTSASGSYTDAADSTQVIPAATGLAATWGIKCTGIALTKTKAGVFNYEVPTFTIEPQNCGTTAVTYTTAAVRGSGTRAQVQELEWLAQGNLGNKWRITTPPAVMYDNTVSGGTYNTYTITYKTGQDGTGISTMAPSYGELILCCHVTGNASAGIRLMLVHWGAVLGVGSITS